MFLVFPVDFCVVFKKGKERKTIQPQESKSKNKAKKHVHCPSDYESWALQQLAKKQINQKKIKLKKNILTNKTKKPKP